MKEAWKLRDPVGFAAQEERRRFYNDMKKKGKGKKTAAVAMPALACKWFLDTENERFYDDPYDAEDPFITWSLDEPEPTAPNACLVRYASADRKVGQGGPAASGSATAPALSAMSCQLDELNKLLLQAEQDNITFYESAIQNMQREIDVLKASSVSAAVAVRSSKNGTIFSCSTTAELLADAKTWLQKGSPTRYLRGVDTLLIELCASANSELNKNVPYGSCCSPHHRQRRFHQSSHSRRDLANHTHRQEK